MRLALTGVFAICVCASSGGSQTPNPMDSISRMPSYRPAHDTIPLITPARIAALPEKQRRAWQAYLDSSQAQLKRDTTAMNAELARLGKKEMTRAPFSKGFEIEDRMTPEWFASDSARKMADNILSFQAPNGGWSKHVDLTAGPRQAGQSYFSETEKWSWISTIDNSATTSQMRFLAAADRAKHDDRYVTSFNRGVKYLLASQYPNGCWPQVWPLEGSYHDAATFNDDASLNAAALLKDVASGKFPIADAAYIAPAKAAVHMAIDCFLNTQATVNGKLTVWGQQHDPISLEPTSARSYELTSLTAQESANIMRFLMKIDSPSDRLVNAIHAAADWLKSNQLSGFTYSFDGGKKEAPGAGPVWARMYEIGTNKPIFSDRNGIKLYDWNQLKDRRQGYGWYTYSPVLALKQYDSWAKKHQRPVALNGTASIAEHEK